MGITTESSGSRKARQKLFSQAGLIAVRAAQNAGFPITYAENDSVIKEYSDGRKEFLDTVASNRILSIKKFNIK